MDFWLRLGQDIVLTPEEASEAQRFRDMMNKPGMNLHVKQEYKERFEKAAVAQSLAFNAQYLSEHGRLTIGDTYEQLAERVAKAYAIHPLPIYVFYFANVLQEAGQTEDAQIFFRNFQKILSDFRSDEFDEINHNLHDVSGALKVAREKAPTFTP